MKTAFVLTGGASLGAVQVGMLRALSEAGVRPDLLAGSSVGAINAAWVAAHPGAGLEPLAAIWRGLRREAIFPAGLGAAAALLGRADHVVAPDRLRRLLEASLGDRRFEDLSLPLHVLATDVMTGQAVVLSRGPLVPALLASAAIPAIYPPVRIGRRLLVDGGIAGHAPVAQAAAQGAEHVIVLPAGHACALREPPRSALAMALHSVTLLIQQQLIHELDRVPAGVRVSVLPPLCPLAVSPADFSHADELMERAYRSTRRRLAAGGEAGAEVLAFHGPHAEAG